MEVFYVIGGITAAWALLVTALGVMRKGFPGSRTAEIVVSAISIGLVAGTIGAAVIGAASEEEHVEEEPAEAAEAVEEQPAGEGGAQAPASAEEDEGVEAGTGQAPPGQEAAVGGGSSLELTADPANELAFDEEALEAAAGTVRLVMRNPSDLQHNVAVEGNGVDEQGEIVGKAGTSEVEAELEPGEYTFYCSVGGHREGGMEGTLSVQ